VAVVGLGTAVVWLDFAVNIGFPAIVRHFDRPTGDVQWIVIAYVLTYTCLMLAFGRLGDRLGHALVFRLGLAWSAATLLLCALAPSFAALLFCRFLQGIGAALVLSCGPALATGFYPEEGRSRVLGAYTMLAALGASLGPLLGGALVEAWGWSAVFWFRAPVALLALIALRRPPAPPQRAARAPLDVAGAALLAVALAALVLGLNRLSELAALPLFLVALAALAGFVRQETRAAQPMLDLRVLRLPGFAALNLASVLTNLASFAIALLVPFYLARSIDLSLAASGAVLASSALGATIAGPAGGGLIGRIRADRLALIGAIMAGIGLALIAFWDGGTAIPALVAVLLLQGLGLGFFQLAYIDIVVASLPRADRGVAGSLAMVTRTLGTVGAATLVMLLFQKLEAASGFYPAFQRCFVLAALIPFAMAGLMAWRARR
jgi:MFS family permease